MSFQRPINSTTTNGGPSSASYSEFLKDIYSSLRTLTTGLNGIHQRLDTLTQQFQSLDARLDKQEQMSQTLVDRLDTLIQQRENSQIRQTTTGLSLLSELDNLGTRQVEPSTGLAELGSLNSKSITNISQVSKLSFQLSRIPELPELYREQTTNIDIEQDLDIHNVEATQTNVIVRGQQFQQPSTALEPSHGSTQPSAQLGTNFLILE
jgi:hypothetical protein